MLKKEKKMKESEAEERKQMKNKEWKKVVDKLMND